MTGSPVCITCGDIAVPMRVLRTGADGLADCVDEDGQTSQVELALVDAAPGDKVLVHACVAIQILDDRPDAGRPHQSAGLDAPRR